MGRTRTFLGLALIVVGTILLSRALMQPVMPDIPALPDMPALPPVPAMPALPPVPAMPALPALPAVPPLPPIPPVAPMHPAPSFHSGAWLSPALIVLVLLAAFWLRRRGTPEQPLA